MVVTTLLFWISFWSQTYCWLKAGPLCDPGFLVKEEDKAQARARADTVEGTDTKAGEGGGYCGISPVPGWEHLRTQYHRILDSADARISEVEGTNTLLRILTAHLKPLDTWFNCLI